jgi:hypothetical protein
LRDFFSKISDTQYIALNMLEAPVLGFILSYIIRYIADPNSDLYIFRENENLPIYIFMSLIVALFLGLTVSAEEIFGDRKILKRESFLNLSRSSYLASKIFILFSISAIQSLSFVLIANSILGIHDMYLTYWFALFSTAAFANMLGLNISASFNSAVTIYILIPLVMIPMMVLSGAMFSFDKPNRNVGSVDKVPLLAEFMVTKWSYEALMVHQFKDNKFEKPFFELEKKESYANYKLVYTIPSLQRRLEACNQEFQQAGKIEKTSNQLFVLRNEIGKELGKNSGYKFKNAEGIMPDKFSDKMAIALQSFLNKMENFYSTQYNDANLEKEKRISNELERNAERYKMFKDTYYNENVADMVRKVLEKEENKILEYNQELVQAYHPIYFDPTIKSVFSWRSHFYAPTKPFLGHFYDTFWYNMIVILIFTSILFVTLYYESLKKLLDFIGKLQFRKENPE